jgi:hypothetical protein
MARTRLIRELIAFFESGRRMPLSTEAAHLAVGLGVDCVDRSTIGQVWQ